MLPKETLAKRNETRCFSPSALRQALSPRVGDERLSVHSASSETVIFKEEEAHWGGALVSLQQEAEMCCVPSRVMASSPESHD